MNEFVDRSREGGLGSGQASMDAGAARFRAFLDASTDIIYRVSPDWDELREVDGRGMIADTLQPRRDWIDHYVFVDDRDLVLAEIRRAIETRTPFELQHRVLKKDGTVGWTLSRAVPLFYESGEISEWFGAATDVTERHAMAEEMARLSAASDQQRRFYESLISATPDLVYAFDRDYRFIFANQALLEMWGRTLEESVGKRLLEIGYELWHAEMHEREIDQVIATKAGIRGEVAFPHAVLGRRVYDYIFMPVFDAEGEVTAIAGTTRDITDIKQSEEHLKLLINELNHRVKNTLATVQSLAKHTFRGSDVDPIAQAAFEERLLALSNAHTVLTKTNWESADLRDIAAQALSPFEVGGSGQERFTLHGDAIALVPQTALALAMALHELASNAVKYGALSNDRGSIELNWTVESRRVHLVWQERDGPPVQSPSRRGFGYRLLERGLAGELGGTVHLEFPASGVRCTMEFVASEGENGD